jgi:hypothetical protein
VEVSENRGISPVEEPFKKRLTSGAVGYIFFLEIPVCPRAFLAESADGWKGESEMPAVQTLWVFMFCLLHTSS